jgi:hypothetical protein
MICQWRRKRRRRRRRKSLTIKHAEIFFRSA